MSYRSEAKPYYRSESKGGTDGKRSNSDNDFEFALRPRSEGKGVPSGRVESKGESKGSKDHPEDDSKPSQTTGRTPSSFPADLVSGVREFMSRHGSVQTFRELTQFLEFISLGRTPSLVALLRRLHDRFVDLDVDEHLHAPVSSAVDLMGSLHVPKSTWAPYLEEFATFIHAKRLNGRFGFPEFIDRFSSLLVEIDSPTLSVMDSLLKLRLEAGISAVHEAVKLVKRLLVNLALHPHDRKYRAVKVQSVHHTLWQYPSGQKLLAAVGFKPVHEISRDIRVAPTVDILRFDLRDDQSALPVVQSLIEQLDAAIVMLEDAPAVSRVVDACLSSDVHMGTLIAALATAEKLASNLVTRPNDCKFFVIRASNKAFVDAVGSLKQHGDMLMAAIGFRPVVKDGEKFFVFRSVSNVQDAIDGGRSITLHPSEQPFLLQRCAELRDIIHGLEHDLLISRPPADKKTRTSTSRPTTPSGRKSKSKAPATLLASGLLQGPDNVTNKDWATCLTAILGIISKLTQEDDKYRRIRLSNHVFFQKIGRFRRGVEILRHVGFTHTDDDTLVYSPSAADDVRLTAYIQEVTAFCAGLKGLPPDEMAAHSKGHGDTKQKPGQRKHAADPHAHDKHHSPDHAAHANNKENTSSLGKLRGDLTATSKMGSTLHSAATAAAASAPAEPSVTQPVNDRELAKALLKTAAMERTVLTQKSVISQLNRKLTEASEAQHLHQQVLFEVGAVSAAATQAPTTTSKRPPAPPKVDKSLAPLSTAPYHLEEAAAKDAGTLIIVSSQSPEAAEEGKPHALPVKAGVLVLLGQRHEMEIVRVAAVKGTHARLQTHLEYAHKRGSDCHVYKASSANLVMLHRQVIAGLARDCIDGILDLVMEVTAQPPISYRRAVNVEPPLRNRYRFKLRTNARNTIDHNSMHDQNDHPSSSSSAMHTSNVVATGDTALLPEQAVAFFLRCFVTCWDKCRDTSFAALEEEFIARQDLKINMSDLNFALRGAIHARRLTDFSGRLTWFLQKWKKPTVTWDQYMQVVIGSSLPSSFVGGNFKPRDVLLQLAFELRRAFSLLENEQDLRVFVDMIRSGMPPSLDSSDELNWDSVSWPINYVSFRNIFHATVGAPELRVLLPPETLPETSLLMDSVPATDATAQSGTRFWSHLLLPTVQSATTSVLSMEICAAMSLVFVLMSDSSLSVHSLADMEKVNYLPRIAYAEPVMADKTVEYAHEFERWMQEQGRSKDVQYISSNLWKEQCMIAGASMMAVDASSGLLAFNTVLVSDSISVHDPFTLKRMFRIKWPFALHGELRRLTLSLRNGDVVDMKAAPLTDGMLMKWCVDAQRSRVVCTVAGHASAFVIGLSDGAVIHELNGHISPVTALYCDPQLPHACFTGSSDCTLRVWALPAAHGRRKDRTPDLHHRLITCLRDSLFSADRNWTLCRACADAPAVSQGRTATCTVQLSDGRLLKVDNIAWLRDPQEATRGKLARPRWSEQSRSTTRAGDARAMFRDDYLDIVEDMMSTFHRRQDKKLSEVQFLLSIVDDTVREGFTPEEVEEVLTWTSLVNCLEEAAQLSNSSASRKLQSSVASVHTVATVASIASLPSHSVHIALDTAGFYYIVQVGVLQRRATVLSFGHFSSSAPSSGSGISSLPTLSYLSLPVGSSKWQALDVNPQRMEDAFRIDLLVRQSSQVFWRGFVFVLSDHETCLPVETSCFLPMLVTLSPNDPPNLSLIADKHLTTVSDIYFNLRSHIAHIIYAVALEPVTISAIFRYAKGEQVVQLGADAFRAVRFNVGSEFAGGMMYRDNRSAASVALTRSLTSPFGCILSHSANPAANSTSSETRTAPVFLWQQLSTNSSNSNSSACAMKSKLFQACAQRHVWRATGRAGVVSLHAFQQQRRWSRLRGDFQRIAQNMITVDQISDKNTPMLVLRALKAVLDRRFISAYHHEHGHLVHDQRSVAMSVEDEGRLLLLQSTKESRDVQRWSRWQPSSAVSDASLGGQLEWQLSMLDGSLTTLQTSCQRASQLERIVTCLVADYLYPATKQHHDLKNRTRRSSSWMPDYDATGEQNEAKPSLSLQVLSTTRMADVFPGLHSMLYTAEDDDHNEYHYLVLQYASPEEKAHWREICSRAKSVLMNLPSSTASKLLLLPDDSARFQGEDHSNFASVYRWDVRWRALDSIIIPSPSTSTTDSDAVDPELLWNTLCNVCHATRLCRDTYGLQMNSIRLDTVFVTDAGVKCMILPLLISSTQPSRISHTIADEYFNFCQTNPWMSMFLPVQAQDFWRNFQQRGACDDHSIQVLAAVLLAKWHATMPAPCKNTISSAQLLHSAHEVVGIFMGQQAVALGHQHTNWRDTVPQLSFERISGKLELSAQDSRMKQVFFSQQMTCGVDLHEMARVWSQIVQRLGMYYDPLLLLNQANSNINSGRKTLKVESAVDVLRRELAPRFLLAFQTAVFGDVKHASSALNDDKLNAKLNQSATSFRTMFMHDHLILCCRDGWQSIDSALGRSASIHHPAVERLLSITSSAATMMNISHNSSSVKTYYYRNLRDVVTSFVHGCQVGFGRDSASSATAMKLAITSDVITSVVSVRRLLSQLTSSDAHHHQHHSKHHIQTAQEHDIQSLERSATSSWTRLASTLDASMNTVKHRPQAWKKDNSSAAAVSAHDSHVDDKIRWNARRMQLLQIVLSVAMQSTSPWSYTGGARALLWETPSHNSQSSNQTISIKSYEHGRGMRCYQDFKALEKVLAALPEAAALPVQLDDGIEAWSTYRGSAQYVSCAVKLLRTCGNAFSFWEGKDDVSSPVKTVLQLIQTLLPMDSSHHTSHHHHHGSDHILNGVTTIPAQIIDMMQAMVDFDIASFIAPFFSTHRPPLIILLLDIFRRTFRFLLRLSEDIRSKTEPFAALGKQFTSASWMRALSYIVVDTAQSEDVRKSAFDCLHMISTCPVYIRHWRACAVLVRMRRFSNRGQALDSERFPDPVYLQHAQSLDRDVVPLHLDLQQLHTSVVELQSGFATDELPAIHARVHSMLQRLTSTVNRLDSSAEKQVHAALPPLFSAIAMLLPRGMQYCMSLMHTCKQVDKVDAVAGQLYSAVDALSLLQQCKHLPALVDCRRLAGEVFQVIAGALVIPDAPGMTPTVTLLLSKCALVFFRTCESTSTVVTAQYSDTWVRELCLMLTALLRHLRSRWKKWTTGVAVNSTALVNTLHTASTVLQEMLVGGDVIVEAMGDHGVLQELCLHLLADTTEVKQRELSQVLHPRALSHFVVQVFTGYRLLRQADSLSAVTNAVTSLMLQTTSSASSVTALDRLLALQLLPAPATRESTPQEDDLRKRCAVWLATLGHSRLNKQAALVMQGALEEKGVPPRLWQQQALGDAALEWIIWSKSTRAVLTSTSSMHANATAAGVDDGDGDDDVEAGHDSNKDDVGVVGGRNVMSAETKAAEAKTLTSSSSKTMKSKSKTQVPSASSSTRLQRPVSAPSAAVVKTKKALFESSEAEKQSRLQQEQQQQQHMQQQSTLSLVQRLGQFVAALRCLFDERCQPHNNTTTSTATASAAAPAATAKSAHAHGLDFDSASALLALLLPRPADFSAARSSLQHYLSSVRDEDALCDFPRFVSLYAAHCGLLRFEPNTACVFWVPDADGQWLPVSRQLVERVLKASAPFTEAHQAHGVSAVFPATTNNKSGSAADKWNEVIVRRDCLGDVLLFLGVFATEEQLSEVLHRTRHFLRGADEHVLGIQEIAMLVVQLREMLGSAGAL